MPLNDKDINKLQKHEKNTGALSDCVLEFGTCKKKLSKGYEKTS